MAPNFKFNFSRMKKRSAARYMAMADDHKLPTSISTEDEALIRALQNFIAPLVHEKQHRDTDAKLLGLEATVLIRALRSFISRTMERPAGEEAPVVELGPDRDLATAGPISLVTTRAPEGNTTEIVRHENSEEPPAVLLNRTKIFHSLREHVFNKMPIRMLRITPHENNLQLSLIERGAIYTHLVPFIEAKVEDPQYNPRYLGIFERMETEDEAIDRLIRQNTGYAILSHTWLRTSPGEITYGDWKNKAFNAKDLGYQKLQNFCRIAWTDYGLTLGWMDTLCINKESSTELDESIRSMFNWYERAKICIIHLAEATTITEMYSDPWFTRGWTLQELLAPDTIKFYNRNWEPFIRNPGNDKTDSDEIVEQVLKATSIEDDELRAYYETPLSRRMQWAASRQVTREEDMAYSLMGIFDVSMSTAYGEGADRAFYRLLQAILDYESIGILELFNWAGRAESRYSRSEILPPTPQVFLKASSDIYLARLRPIEPLTLTHLGLRIPVILMPGAALADSEVTTTRPIGNFTAIVNVVPVRPYMQGIATTYRLLDDRVTSGPDGHRPQGPATHQYTFAMFNIGQGTKGIIIPQICIAFGLECSEDAGKVTSTGKSYPFQTREPIVFEMEDWSKSESERKERHEQTNEDLYGTLTEILADDLTTHGMQLISLYL